MDCNVQWLRNLVRTVHDFPSEGVRFIDIAPLLNNGDALRCSIEIFAAELVGLKVDAVAAIEARGFLVGAPLATRLGVGVIPIRKAGKLPGELHRIDYELEYGTATLEIQKDAAKPGDRIVIVDDVLATGGTFAAATKLVSQTGAQIEALGYLFEIAGLNGAASLDETCSTNSIDRYCALGAI